MAEPRSDVLGTADGRHNGGSQTLTPNCNWKTLISLHGLNLSPDVFTLTWSITDVPLTQNLTGTFNLRGLAKWGSGASIHSAEFDLGRCGNISFAGSSIEFSGRNLSTSGPKWNVQVSVAYGTRGAGAASVVTLTEGFVLDDGGLGIIKRLPNFARRYSVQVKDEALIGAGLAVEELTPNNVLLRTYKPLNSTVFRTIANDVTTFRVKGPAATPLEGVLVFELCL